MGWFKKIFRNPIAKIALPILATAVAPGLGTALSSGLGLGLSEAAAAGLGGAVAGGAGGALTGGGFKGALKGAALGGAGGYLSNGGFSQIAPQTSSFLGNTTGNLIGTGTSSTGSLGSLLGTSGLTDSIGSELSSLSGLNPFIGSSAGTTSADNSFLNKAALSSQGFSPSDVGFLSKAGAGVPNVISGGGSSIFGGGGSGVGSLLGAGYGLYSNKQALGNLTDAERKAQALLAPYQATGQAANQQLSTALQNGTLGGTFDAGDLTQDPGYQFNLNQGSQALDRQQSSRGNYFSGQALKDAETFGQGLADNTYNNAYQRWLQGQQNTYGMLSGTSNAGQGAANTAADLTTSIGSAKAGSQIATSNLINNSLARLLAGRNPISGYGNPLSS